MFKSMTLIALAVVALASSRCATLEPPLPEAAPAALSAWPACQARWRAIAAYAFRR